MSSVAGAGSGTALARADTPRRSDSCAGAVALPSERAVERADAPRGTPASDRTVRAVDGPACSTSMLEGMASSTTAVVPEEPLAMDNASSGRRGGSPQVARSAAACSSRASSPSSVMCESAARMRGRALPGAVVGSRESCCDRVAAVTPGAAEPACARACAAVGGDAQLCATRMPRVSAETYSSLAPSCRTLRAALKLELPRAPPCVSWLLQLGAGCARECEVAGTRTCLDASGASVSASSSCSTLSASGPGSGDWRS